MTGGKFATIRRILDIQNGIKVDFPKEVNKMLDEAKFLDIKFPTENIEKKWKNGILAE